MAHFKLALGTLAAALLATTATAQTNTVIQPVGEIDDNVVRAQFIKPGDVSPEEYQRLLDEADKIRAFRNSQGDYTQGSYTGVSINEAAAPTQASAQTSAASHGGRFMTDSHGYKIEMFDAPVGKTYNATPVNTSATTLITASAPVVTYQSAPVAVARASHYVVKGDTLYNIAKRNDMTVAELQSANGLTTTALKLGQTLTIPGQTLVQSAPVMAPVTTVSSLSTTSEPVVSTQRGTTLVRNVEPLPASNIYAVLPKDTLYSISRRSCVGVDVISSLNSISDPSTIQPGQRLTLPSGHCLK